MKNWNILISSLMIAGSAQAEPAWVQTVFWKAPVPEVQTVKISADREDLGKICDEYRSTVGYAGGSALDPEEIDLLRRNDTFFSDFSAIFRVNGAATLEILKAQVNEANEQLSRSPHADELPAFSTTLESLSMASMPVSEIRIDGSPGSLLEISGKAKLQPLKIQSLGEGDKAFYKVFGKDSVCDLYQGKARLEFMGRAVATIPKESQAALDGFYREFEDATQSVFAGRKSPVARAALLGYRTGLSLDRVNKDPDQVAKQIEKLVGTFFDENMERNFQWKNVQGEMRLSVPSSVWTKVKVKAEK